MEKANELVTTLMIVLMLVLTAVRALALLLLEKIASVVFAGDWTAIAAVATWLLEATCASLSTMLLVFSLLFPMLLL